MKVFSSYYDKLPELDTSAYTLVRVSHNAPPEWVSKDIIDLSSTFGPTTAMLEECHPLNDWEAFKPRYEQEILGALDKEATLAWLYTIHLENGNRPLLLLCFEAPPDHCHRHLIGSFLGVNIEEI